MKTTQQKSRQDRGIALIITVILIAFAALYFITYLVLTSNEYNTVARSQTWNSALPVAEAGVEEGLALVNKNAYDTTAITNWPVTASLDGWSNTTNIIAGTNTFQVFSISRTLPNNTGSYVVYVTNIIPSGATYGTPTILSIGTVQNESVPTVSRSILVQTAAISIGSAGGVVSQDGITASGDVEFDSWDSSTSLHCIWQSNTLFRANYYNPGIAYGIWSNSLSYVSNSYPSRTAAINMFTDSNIVDLTGNVTVAGYLQTGPNGTESVGGNCSVGDLLWCFGATGTGGQTGLEPGHWEQDANQNFHSYPLPNPTNSWQSTWLPVPSPTNIIKIGGVWWYTNSVWTNMGGVYYTNGGGGYTIAGTTYSQVITNMLQNTNYVYYAMNQLGSSLFVDAQYVVLYLTNGWSYSGQQVFTLNTNADITVWTAGNITAKGKAVINNLANYTHAFSVYDIAGTSPTVTVELGGNGAATGYYYLPSSAFQLDGGGNSGDFVGSIICYDFTDGGHVNVHFDQSLGTTTTPDQFIPSSWTEVTTQ